jgi:hypothetical protein
MTTRPIADLVEIVRNGGCLDLQAGNLSRDELVELVRNMHQNATVTLRGLNTRATEELVHITRNSNVGTVIFVLD